jgi:hypothetical protein
MVDPQPTLVERLVRHVLLPRELLPQIEINSIEDNELGVILNRHVEMDAVRPLMKTLLTQMAKAFPGQHLTVIAYTPSEPPMKIGTARLNARTRQMTYTPAVSQ